LKIKKIMKRLKRDQFLLNSVEEFQWQRAMEARRGETEARSDLPESGRSERWRELAKKGIQQKKHTKKNKAEGGGLLEAVS